MHRFALLLSVVVVLFGGAVAISRPSASAQDTTPTGAEVHASHPAAGTWTFVNVEGEDAFPSIAHFHPDGTYVEVMPWGSVLMGVWQPTGENTATVTQIINYLTDDDELVQGQGRATVEIDETGNTMTWRSSFLSRFQDGRTDIAYDADESGNVSTGTRLEPQPMASLEDLMAMPIPFGAATPTP